VIVGLLCKLITWKRWDEMELLVLTRLVRGNENAFSITINSRKRRLPCKQTGIDWNSSITITPTIYDC
jgi:3,4-dihydroxy-2-butanone 4-phosphate synthase